MTKRQNNARVETGVGIENLGLNRKCQTTEAVQAIGGVNYLLYTLKEN